ncbi:MAG: bifunctional demethylmenaquinone methyltransferase/2-methoxy-6-polyprenyl-1,4-benzoquinol methylase UbiE [Pirellulaceae bacterium]
MATASTTQTPSLDKSNDRVREMFRQIAPRYDLMNHLLSLNIDKRWRNKTVERLRIEGTEPILDVCTGTGDLALAISRRAGQQIQVLASDFCHEMLAIGRHKGSQCPGVNVEFLEADAQQLPFDDNQFQVVTVAFGLRNVADTDRGLSEMVRVCRPGGQVVVLEFSQPTVVGLKQAYQFYFRQVLPRIGQKMARNNKSAYSYLPESVSQFPCGEALADRMRSAGLRDVRFKPLTFGVATFYEGTK